MSRDLFAELKKGIESFQQYNFKIKSKEKIRPDEIKPIREKLNIS
ncbi:Similar to putative DNA-binding protein (fragment) [Xenorhabdus bovienii str. kraussei Quebec]|uniref:Similar to putative DNA-binding protein n=1 Tax=Xenorhabdus bovienii str. kraussei Quebec TaxID=1398203 RepID=A0A077PKB3_XENBV